MSVAKILIVEDEWLVAQGINENLQDLGYEVTGLVSSGEEALRLAAENPPDLVVMDILLQGDMDGIEAAGRLRREFNLPVVFLTAYADSQTLERAKVTEPYGYILKPFEVRELHSAVEIALYKNRAEKRLQHLTEVLRAIRNVNQLIVQEKDRDRLIEKACQLLTEGRGYFTAWIALMEEGGKVAAFTVAGEEGDTAGLRQLLRQGELPRCGCRALQQSGLLVIEDLSPASGCFLWKNYQDRGALVTPLSHHEYGYGVLGVLLPVSLSRDGEELTLFQELSADLSLALYNLDLEERESRAQTALKASEEKFRLLVENANQIILVAQGGHIRFANPLALENSGYSLEELTSRPFLEFVHPDDREMTRKIYADRLEGREAPEVFYIRYFHKNGACRWAEIKTSAITWEGEAAMLSCLSDITEKKEMVEALRQSEEKFRMFFENAPIGYHSLDDQGVIKEVNPTWLETLGYTREEVIGRWVGDFLTPEYRKHFSEKFKRFKELGKSRDVAVDMVKKDGSVITASFNGKVVFDAKGRFLRTHCVFSDITAHQRAEAALRDSEERYRTVADFTYDMEYWLGPDHSLIYMSPACERLTGYTREEFFKTQGLLQKIVHPEDRDQIDQHRKEAQSCSHHLDLDFRLIHRNGREIWVSHACQPVYGLDGRYLGRRVSNRDITERKRFEKELEEISQFNQEIINSAGEGIIVYDRQFRYKSWNKFMEEMTGVRAEEVLNRVAFDVFPHLREQNIEKLMRWALSGETVTSTEVPFVIPETGKSGWVIDTYAPHLNAAGEIIGVIATVSEVTQRKRSEEALRESEERFRQLVENAPDAIVIQAEKRFAYLNKEAFKLFGATGAEQLLGQPWLERFPTELHDLIRERIRLVNIERKALHPTELQLIKMDGTIVEVEASTVPFRYQDKNGGLVFFRDITERKKAEQEVQEGMRLNQTLLDSLPCVALLLRPRTREIVAANAVAVQAGAVTGKQCFATWAQRQDPCPFCLAPRVWETGREQHLEIEYAGVYWDAHWVPLKDDLYLHYAFDITERKEAEKAQKLVEAQLFQAQKMEALGTLAGGIAHDFNNILGAMLGFAELTYYQLADGSEEKHYLDNILKAGDRARHLVKQILSFSRQEKVERQPLSLPPIIKETIKFLRASLPTTIDIRTRLEDGKAMVVADPTQIHQVLLNLATNATHAMEEKGGVLEIGLKKVQLAPKEISLYEGIAPGPYLEMRVGDTGCGMEPGVRERIFEPFFTTKEPWKGTGMGLSVVYGIVKALEGTIKVTSELGQGTTFLVLLPLAEDRVPEAEPEVLAPLSRGVGRILFVDDDADFFKAGKLMLGELGYEVRGHRSSREALQEFQARPDNFDLIICDQTMPGLTGLELAAACASLRPDLPIILCTGFSESVTPEKARAAGIAEVVTKPYDLRHIGKIIQKVLKKNKIRTE